MYRARFIGVTYDSSKSNGCHIKTTGMRRTSSGRNISLHPGQNGRCPIVIENSKVRMSRYLDTSGQNTNGPNHGPVWKMQSFFLSETCIVILWQDYCGKGNSRKFYHNTVGKKFQVVNAYFVNREEGQFLSVHVDDIELAGKKQNIDPMWKYSWKTWFGRIDIIPWPRLFGLHSKRMSNKQRYCRQLQEHARIQNLCWSFRKATKYREIWREHFLMVLWHGR